MFALIEEVLARNPEHIAALRILARYHSWLKDEIELRAALERVAESARINDSVEDERYALAKLVALVPHERAILRAAPGNRAGSGNFDSEESISVSEFLPGDESDQGLDDGQRLMCRKTDLPWAKEPASKARTIVSVNETGFQFESTSEEAEQSLKT